MAPANARGVERQLVDRPERHQGDSPSVEARRANMATQRPETGGLNDYERGGDLTGSSGGERKRRDKCYEQATDRMANQV